MAIGSTSTSTGPPATCVHSTACSCPGSRLVKKDRSPRQAGVPTTPTLSSSRTRSAKISRPGQCARSAENNAASARSQSARSALSVSSIQR